MAVLTDKQLAAQLLSWRKKKGLKGPFGIRTDQEFRGSRRLEIDGQVYVVSDCQSDLQARELLAKTDEGGLVLLFRIGHQQLGEDLLARLEKERLLSVDNRQSLRELFQAASIDPRILSNPKLVDALVATAAARGGIAAPVGVLDMDLTWSVLLGRPEVIHRRPDLSTLLRWSLADEDWGCIRNLEPEVRKAFFDWVADRSGDAARFMEAAEANGHSETLVPIGLALGVLFQEGMGQVNLQIEGRVRIEDFTGKQSIPAAPAMAWHMAAAAVMKELASMDRAMVAKRLDQLLKAVKIESLAIYSDYSERRAGQPHWRRPCDTIWSGIPSWTARGFTCSTEIQPILCSPRCTTNWPSRRERCGRISNGSSAICWPRGTRAAVTVKCCRWKECWRPWWRPWRRSGPCCCWYWTE
jgi:hypothetical protein